MTRKMVQRQKTQTDVLLLQRLFWLAVAGYQIILPRGLKKQLSFILLTSPGVDRE